MSKIISIAIDAMGGDNSPEKTIEGIKIFLDKNNNNNDFVLNIFGKEEILNEKINKLQLKSNKINIINSNTKVSDEETPLTAIKNSKNTSMWNCIQHQLDGKSDISLSAGNTGVLLVISRMILKMMDEVSKPALAGLWPNKNGMNVVLDLGANIECNDQNLVDFAELGSALFKSLYPNNKPKVSLLNIGSEEIKGTEMLKTASKRLRELSNEENFIYKGYIEGNNIMKGESNVIIT
jgi:glycerol-3-phosphate acyltransferase PlsX